MMARFDYLCKNCDIVWEREASVGKAPKRTKCPNKCGKFGNRYYGDQTLHVNWGADTDFNTVRARNAKYDRDGMNKQEADKFLNDSIARSEKHTNQGWQQYSRIVPNGEEHVKRGIAKKRTEEQYTKALDNAKQLTRDCYNNVRRDPGKLDFDKPQ